MRTLGAVLAGGMSSRFGSDKAEAFYGDHSLLAHAVMALREYCGTSLVVVGRPVAEVQCVPDWPAPGLGPLGGLAGALRHAIDSGHDQLLTVSVDCVGLPAGLLARLGDAPAYLTAQPVIGLWPVSAMPMLERRLASGESRSVRSFADEIGARAVHGAVPLGNINTPDDLLALSSPTPWAEGR